MKPLLLLLIFLTTINISAEIRYVSKTSTPAVPFTSWQTASRTIQGAVDVSKSGDTIYVGEGIFEEQVNLKRGISLIGMGIDVSFIKATKDSLATINMYDSSLVKGFTIGMRPLADGIWFMDDMNRLSVGSIEYNKFKDVYNAISIADAEFTINNNFFDVKRNALYIFNSLFEQKLFFHNNYLSVYGNGIKVAIGPSPYILNNVALLRKGSSYFYAGSYGDKAYISNNLILSEGDAFSGISNSMINYTLNQNNVLIGNYLNEAIFVQPHTEIINNVIIGADYAFGSLRAGLDSVKYNCLYKVGQPANIPSGYNNKLDSTNIIADPMFRINGGDSLSLTMLQTDPLGYYLQALSPLIDRGHPAFFDKDGSRSDIGLFGGEHGESYIYKDYAPAIPKGLLINKTTGGINLTWNKNEESDFLKYIIYIDSIQNFKIDSTKKLTEQSVNTLFIDTTKLESSIFFKIVSVDKQSNISVASEEVGIRKPVGLNDERFTIVDNNYLYQNYPNPFNPSTRISYKINKDGYLRLRVYDIKGELVEVIKEGTVSKGYYEENYTPKGLASGMYILRIDISDNNNIPVYSEQRKMLLVK